MVLMPAGSKGLAVHDQSTLSSWLRPAMKPWSYHVAPCMPCSDTFNAMSKHLPSGARPGKLDSSGAAKNPALASRSEPVSSPHGGSQQNTAAEPGPGSAEGLPLSMGEGGSEVGSDDGSCPACWLPAPPSPTPCLLGLTFQT